MNVLGVFYSGFSRRETHKRQCTKTKKEEGHRVFQKDVVRVGTYVNGH